MAERDDVLVDWTRTCWSRRFSGEACLQPARWKGPDLGPFNRVWRACDEHHLPTDIPMEDAQ